jgi:hypothetical protein
MTSPIDKAANWGDEHQGVILPLAILAALKGNEGPIEEDEAVVQAKVTSVADAIENWLGKGWKQELESGSDLALKSADGTRRIRFDLIKSRGLPPHINLELWKMRNLYPGDRTWDEVINKHIFPK